LVTAYLPSEKKPKDSSWQHVSLPANSGVRARGVITSKTNGTEC
jgi:hypothetical protein